MIEQKSVHLIKNNFSKIAETDNIFQRCSAKEVLGDGEVKNMFETLSLCIRELYLEVNRVNRKDKRIPRPTSRVNQIGADCKSSNSKKISAQKLESTRQRKQLEVAKPDRDNTQKLAEKQVNIANVLSQPSAQISIQSNNNFSLILTEITNKLLMLNQKLCSLHQETQNKLSLILSTPTVSKQINQIMKQKQRKEEEQRSVQKRIQEQKQQLKQAIAKAVKAGTWDCLSSKTELNLWGCGIAELPDQIGSLVELTTIWLGKNKISRLPDSVGQLHNLQKLDVSFNNIQNLPQTFSNLSNLIQRKPLIFPKLSFLNDIM